jgi:hypothetical protein
VARLPERRAATCGEAPREDQSAARPWPRCAQPHATDVGEWQHRFGEGSPPFP